MVEASELVEKLEKSDDYFERQKAAWALVEMGPQAVDVLTEALKAGEFSDLRYKSAWALGKIGDPRAIEPLGRAMLDDPDHVVREWSAAALDNLRDQRAVPYLVQAIKTDTTRDVRQRAVVALISLSASGAMRDLLTNSDPDVRGMAITGLAKLRCEEAIDEVAQRLDDDEIEIRKRAAVFMGELTAERALDLLARALKDPEPLVREQSLKSLSSFPIERSCQIALSALKDEDIRVMTTAVTTLGEIGHPSAMQSLIDLMLEEGYEEARAWAAWSLGEIGDKRAIGPLMEACKSCPPEVQNKARNSLKEIFGVEP
jgi:HEAT repeat protein